MELAIKNSGMSVFDSFEKSSSNLNYVKFKGGDFTFGKDEDIIMDDELFMADVASLAKGFICWKGRKPVDEQMATYIDVENGNASFPVEKELPDHSPYNSDKGEGWSEQLKIIFYHLETGEKFQFATTTVGGNRGIGELTKSWVKEVRRGNLHNPVVSMAHWMMPNSFNPKGSAAPKFPVHSWATDIDDAQEKAKATTVKLADPTVV